MKRVLLAGVALAALMGSASAADIPRRVVERPAAAPVPHVVAYNWTGFYAGLNAGWGWGADWNGDGGLVGGTLGYNWQMNNIVFGVETDIAWSGIEGPPSAAAAVCVARSIIDWFGTARGRLGVAMDRFMPYITGGVAYGDVDARVRRFPEQATRGPAGRSAAAWSLHSPRHGPRSLNISLSISAMSMSAAAGGCGVAGTAMSTSTRISFGLV